MPCASDADSFQGKPTQANNGRGSANNGRSTNCLVVDDGAASEKLLVIHVIKAEMLRSFDTFGKMDPFAVVKWCVDGGKSWELSTTPTHWNGHKTPLWNHTCRAVPFVENSADELEFQVIERNVAWSNSFCGSARVSLSDLLEGSRARSSKENTVEEEASAISGPVRTLDLYRQGKGLEITGTIDVQAVLLGSSGVDPCIGGDAQIFRSQCKLTQVKPDVFESPVKRLGVSGGTAAFFALLVKAVEGAPATPAGYFIGKDLCRAEDEVVFYEEILNCGRQQGRGGMGPILDFMFEYLGVLTCDVEGDSHPKELLVLQNLRNGFECPRMLDVKVGQKTASSNWRGKSRLRALRQDMVDGHTNSACEGFRLEGFDNPPPTLDSCDPLLDVGRVGPLGNLPVGDKAKLRKKALRMMMQRMRAGEMFMHFLDVHHSAFNQSTLDSEFCPAETTELMLHEIVLRLVALSIACRTTPVPQKWVGSSVALVFDTARVFLRSEERECRLCVRVNIFDWGRSEFNVAERHSTLKLKERTDREEFWRYYMGGIDRLSWEAARAYWNRFSNAGAWGELSIVIFDFDALSKNDFIGKLIVPVRETNGVVHVGLDGQDTNTFINAATQSASSIKSFLGRARTQSKTHAQASEAEKKRPTISYSMKYEPLPKGGRLSGLWRVCILEAKNLPACDTWGTSDPFCVVSATSEDGKQVLTHQTNVIARDLNPRWNETFDFPVMASCDRLKQGLDAVAPFLGDAVSSSAFAQMEEDGKEARNRCLEAWVTQLDTSGKAAKHVPHPESISDTLYPGVRESAHRMTGSCAWEGSLSRSMSRMDSLKTLQSQRSAPWGSSGSMDSIDEAVAGGSYGTAQEAAADRNHVSASPRTVLDPMNVPPLMSPDLESRSLQVESAVKSMGSRDNGGAGRGLPEINDPRHGCADRMQPWWGCGMQTGCCSPKENSGGTAPTWRPDS